MASRALLVRGRSNRELAIDYVKIRPAYTARQHLYEHTRWPGYGLLDLS